MSYSNYSTMLDHLARAITLVRADASPEETSYLFSSFSQHDQSRDGHDLPELAAKELFNLVQRYLTKVVFVDDGARDEGIESPDAGGSDQSDRSRVLVSYICLNNMIRVYDRATGEQLGEQPFILDEDELDDLTGEDRWQYFFFQSVQMGVRSEDICFQDCYFSSKLETIETEAPVLKSNESYLKHLAIAFSHCESAPSEQTMREVIEFCTSGPTKFHCSMNLQLLRLREELRKYQRELQSEAPLTMDEARCAKLCSSPYYLVVFPERDLAVVLIKSTLEECFWFPLSSAIGEKPYDHRMDQLEVVFDYFVENYCISQFPRFRRAG